MEKKKDMWKIRRMLDDKYYHLHVSFEWDENSRIKETWKLFEKHDYWLTDGSKAIMTSETHTYEDLYKFAKEHYTWNCDLVIGKVSMVILIIILVIAILNCYWHNKILIGFIWGINVFGITISITRLIVSNHNWKISELKYKENLEKLMEDKNE